VNFLLKGQQSAVSMIQQAGFPVACIADVDMVMVELGRGSPVDMVVVDANDAGEGEIRAMRRVVGRLALIDDLALRRVEAEVIINGAIYAEELPYQPTPGMMLLLGQRYALLREAFASEPMRTFPPAVRRILITLGGSDTWNLTPRLVEWTRAECERMEVDVVIGPFYSNAAEIESARPARLLPDPPDMRMLMLAADLAVTGGGQTTYELAATATPALGIQVGADQKRNLEALDNAGVLLHLGKADDPDLESRYRNGLRRLLQARGRRERMGRTGRALVDGRGAERVAEVILECCGKETARS